MNTKRVRPLLAVLAVAALGTVLTSPATGTFPGKNGRIDFIFAPSNPANMLGNVYTVNPNGSDVLQVTSLPPNTSANNASWSPDGRQIVFAEFPPQNAPGQLWLMNADGSNLHLLLSELSYGDYEPSFAPDGSTIVFTRCPTTGTNGCAIYRIQSDGNGLTAITNFQPWVSDFEPWCSPDGRTIAFVNLGRGGVLLGIYLVNADGSNVRLLTPPWIGGDAPSWSPDGRKIAFSSNGSVFDHGGFGLNEEIWVINVDGIGLTRLTSTNQDWHGYLNSPHDTLPSWSPDGSALTFARFSPSLVGSAIYVMNSDGSGLRQILTLPAQPNAGVPPSVSGGNAGPRQSLAQHLRRIETGGVDPQWGPAPR